MKNALVLNFGCEIVPSTCAEIFKNLLDKVEHVFVSKNSGLLEFNFIFDLPIILLLIEFVS